MKNPISDLTPKLIWDNFYKLTQIPHPSKKEEKMIEYLIGFAKERNLAWKKDAVGNILISKPGVKGKENLPIVVLQSHIDMVCEKNSNKVHDFDNDPLTIKTDGEWVSADDTTLGADDGIGAAAALAVLESDDIKHGPIECLFTVDEETGMTGVLGLKEDFVKGRKLLNLDSEDDGVLYIGCAGGKNTILTKQIKKVDSKIKGTVLKLVLGGLQGGHSGIMIDKERGNALKLLGRVLVLLSKKYEYELVGFFGGDKHNAIPREAFADIIIANDDKEEIMNFLKQIELVLKDELKGKDEGIKIDLEEAIYNNTQVYSDIAQFDVINFINAVPNGVFSKSSFMPGMIETSTNLASLNMEDDKIIIVTSQRSSIDSLVTDISNRVISIAALSGMQYEAKDGYPAWTPDSDSKLLKDTKEIFEESFNKKPEVTAIHAGLECAILGSVFKGMEMISFGPTVLGAHTPKERVDIKTVERFWILIKNLLEKSK